MGTFRLVLQCSCVSWLLKTGLKISLPSLVPRSSQILSRSRGEKSEEGLGAKLRYRPEMVDSVSTNQVHVT